MHARIADYKAAVRGSHCGSGLFASLIILASAETVPVARRQRQARFYFLQDIDPVLERPPTRLGAISYDTRFLTVSALSVLVRSAVAPPRFHLPMDW